MTYLRERDKWRRETHDCLRQRKSGAGPARSDGYVKLGEVNRATSAVTMPGGKSAHVAMTAVALGARAVWVGFSGGSTGDENELGLKRLGIEVSPCA